MAPNTTGVVRLLSCCSWGPLPEATTHAAGRRGWVTIGRTPTAPASVIKCFPWGSGVTYDPEDVIVSGDTSCPGEKPVGAPAIALRVLRLITCRTGFVLSAMHFWDHFGSKGISLSFKTMCLCNNRLPQVSVLVGIFLRTHYRNAIRLQA